MNNFQNIIGMAIGLNPAVNVLASVSIIIVSVIIIIP